MNWKCGKFDLMLMASSKAYHKKGYLDFNGIDRLTEMGY